MASTLEQKAPRPARTKCRIGRLVESTVGIQTVRSPEIRQSFIDFFESRGHQHVPSAPLVPQGDATLLFTNAGMVQFKDWFLGVEKPPFKRAVTSQKCLRVSGKHNDLENVGPSSRHHTFFEMLGNFSFGDYFKAEAIEFGWQLVTEGWGLDPEHLFATVFREDDEAFELWEKISSLPTQRIARCGEKDNFWAMGDTGPCGPCSEIFVDRAQHLPKVSFEEGEASGRYVEIWNLVFMQYERDSNGNLEPLPNPSIDTGAGLERVTAVLQDVESNYDTDLFQPLIGAAADAAGKRYGDDENDDTSLRVIADHIRATAFLLADGVIPSNEGRGYVLRRLLRRAVRHGLRLGYEEPFLGQLLPVLSSTMGDTYPELGQTKEASAATVLAEEEKFLATLASGARQVQETIERARGEGRQVLNGPEVFRLYDTYGLPIDSVREIAEEEQFSLDDSGFEQELERQRERSRSAAGDSQALLSGVREVVVDESSAETEFLGYSQLRLENTPVIGLARLEPDGKASAVDSLSPGESGVCVFPKTVFYSESGGQVGDRGELSSASGRAAVLDTQRVAGVVLHTVEVIEGTLEKGTEVTQQVSESVRRQTERHHTATHLLHAALRARLGEGVRQAGSLVHPERLRFDFTHGSPLTEQDCAAIEADVSEWIRRAVPVEIESSSFDEAVAKGAMALFGEKYGDVVRTVHVPGYSLELCGGCHVSNSGAIGEFVLLGERGIASGVRRVEALAGTEAEKHRREQSSRLAAVEEELGVGAERASAEIALLKERLKSAERELSKLRMQVLSGESGASKSSEEVEIAGIKVLTREVPPAPSNELRNLADVLRGRLGSGVVVLGARGDEKVALVAAVTQDLTTRVDAGRLARKLGDAMGGSGGGRSDFAQAGAKDPKRLDDALDVVPAAIEELVAESKVESST